MVKKIALNTDNVQNKINIKLFLIILKFRSLLNTNFSNVQ